MKIKHDKKTDSKYFCFKTGKVSFTKKQEDWLLFDYNEDGDVIGMEILNATDHPVIVSVMGEKLLDIANVEFGLKKKHDYVMKYNLSLNNTYINSDKNDNLVKI